MVQDSQRVQQAIGVWRDAGIEFAAVAMRDEDERRTERDFSIEDRMRSIRSSGINDVEAASMSLEDPCVTIRFVGGWSFEMGEINCWEFKRCGREINGPRAREMGPCPAAELTAADGFLEGHNGGRACTYVTGTFCSDSIQGTHREKQKQCGECEFYQMLQKQHGSKMSVHAFLEFVRK